MIVLESLNKYFGNKHILKSINLTIPKGEITSIIGPSGGGKSTLLRCINGLEKIDSGNILIDGTKLTGKNSSKLFKKIATVFQQFNLFPHFTVLENLTYAPIKVNKIKLESANKMALEFLKKFSLENTAKFLPNDLSGGQKQRVAIIRALMTKPEVILFDEPTSALDIENIKDLVEIINSLRESKLTLVIVTHQINFAKKVSDNVIFMDDGRVFDQMERDAFFLKPTSDRASLFLNNSSGYF